MSTLTEEERRRFVTFTKEATDKHCPDLCILQSQVDKSILRELVLRVTLLEEMIKAQPSPTIKNPTTAEALAPFTVDGYPGNGDAPW
jgi:hypothetical protein